MNHSWISIKLEPCYENLISDITVAFVLQIRAVFRNNEVLGKIVICFDLIVIHFCFSNLHLKIFSDITIYQKNNRKQSKENAKYPCIIQLVSNWIYNWSSAKLKIHRILLVCEYLCWWIFWDQSWESQASNH